MPDLAAAVLLVLLLGLCAGSALGLCCWVCAAA
eukprot:CAMPEP_0119082238 /NCGR_PEP_ID=MMETSP1178-20130426/120378_1 /TAXON_ID=33656 /ORGANISM="unid sp, Strain CCMP2000" /LENGTH=32 /DNA_ID= /DNA_START= /DNA_END= /DNA_ORIENTATION=